MQSFSYKLLGILLLLSSAVIAQQVSTPGLVGNWRMDGDGVNVPDRSGMQNHGTLIGEAALIRDPEMGPAVEIYGPSGAILIPHHACLEPATGTIEAWVRFERMTNADIMGKSTTRLVRSGYDAGISVYGLRVDEHGSPSAFIANDANHYPWTFVTLPGRRIFPYQWYLLTMRWDGSELTLFVNGKPVKAVPYDPIPEIGLSYFGESTFNISTATMWAEMGEHFYGRIAGVRIYNRPLSDEEVHTGWAAEDPGTLNNRRYR